jgi:hypothetical protein
LQLSELHKNAENGMEAEESAQLLPREEYDEPEQNAAKAELQVTQDLCFSQYSHGVPAA